MINKSDDISTLFIYWDIKRVAIVILFGANLTRTSCYSIIYLSLLWLCINTRFQSLFDLGLHVNHGKS